MPLRGPLGAPVPAAPPCRRHRPCRVAGDWQSVCRRVLADVDAGTNPVVVTLTSTNGTATLSTTAGLIVTGNGTALVTSTGPISAQNAALNGVMMANLAQGGTADNISKGVAFFQKLKREPWGARNFIIRDPDGNLLLFAGPAE